MPKIKIGNLSYFFTQVFFVLFLFYLIIVSLEVVFWGAISRFSDINLLLLAVVVFGGLAIIFRIVRKNESSTLKIHLKKDVYFLLIFLLAAAGAALIYYRLEDFSNLIAFVVSAIALLIIVFLASFMYNEPVNKN